MSSVVDAARTRVPGCVSLAPERIEIRAASRPAGDNYRKGKNPMSHRLPIYRNNPAKTASLILCADFMNNGLERSTSLMYTGGYDEQSPPG